MKSTESHFPQPLVIKDFTIFFPIKSVFSFLALVIFWIFLSGCESSITNIPESNETLSSTQLQTKNVVIVVIDGPRYEDTWGHPQRRYIPHFANDLAPQGIHYTNFYNKGATYTTSGHSAVTTGNYQWMSNDGSEVPNNPSVFQLWLEKNATNPKKAQIITSKEKLQVLADCVDPQWRGRFNPLTETQNRDDQLTFDKALEAFQKDQPNFVLIHFRGPDHYGHANDWNSYLNGIEETDRLTYEIWEYLQQDPFYKGTTTMLVTNDHGRHKDGVSDGFVSHGDFCEGCMHISLFAVGPDFHANRAIVEQRESVDVATTAAYLMNMDLPTGSGQVMWELFK